MGGEERRITGGGDTMEHPSLKTISPTQYKVFEAVFMTAFGGVGGAVLGGIVGTVIIAPMYALEGAAVFAAWFGIESIMRGIRGKDDLTSCVVSGSGGGLAYSFVSQGLRGQPAHALFTASYYGALSGVSETIRSCNAQEALYTEARAMLSKLGLEEYEKNYKKGHLTDLTLPLLTDRELQEVTFHQGQCF